jgi:hypothetical protein
MLSVLLSARDLESSASATIEKRTSRRSVSAGRYLQPDLPEADFPVLISNNSTRGLKLIIYLATLAAILGHSSIRLV